MDVFQYVDSKLNSIKALFLKSTNTPVTGQVPTFNGTDGFTWADNGGSGSDTHDVKVSNLDTSPNFLNQKIIGDVGDITISVTDSGADENLKIATGSNIFKKDTDTTNSITETATKVFVSPSEKTAIAHTNRSNLDTINQNLGTTSNALFNTLRLNTSPTGVPTDIGTFYWDSADGTVSVRLKSDVSLQVGQEMQVYGRNNTGVTIANGKAVYISGATGNKATVALASNLVHAHADCVIGLATENVTNNENGLITTFGAVRDINTSAWVEGTMLFLDSVAGELTSTRPTAPKAIVPMGIVLYQHISNGVIFIKPSPIHNYVELSDVDSTGIVDGSHFYWDSASSTFKPLESGFNSKILWEDVVVPIAGLGSGASSPDLTAFLGNIQAYAFAGTATLEQLYGSFEVLHGTKLGTDLRPHIHWCPSDANAGNVKWQLEYTIRNNLGVYSAPTTVSATIATGGIALQHQIVEFPIINGSALTIGAICMFRLFRDPNDAEDTYNSDAFALSFGVHYQVDSDGSRQIATK